MFGIKNEEILTCLLLIVVGYCIAKMFSRSCDGFKVVIPCSSNSDCKSGERCAPDSTCVPLLSPKYKIYEPDP